MSISPPHTPTHIKNQQQKIKQQQQSKTNKQTWNNFEGRICKIWQPFAITEEYGNIAAGKIRTQL